MEDSSYHLVLQIQPLRSIRSIFDIQAILFYLHAIAVPSRIVQFSLVDLLEEGSFHHFNWRSYEGSSRHLGHNVPIIVEII